jgi:hypothetical protein
MPRSTAGHHFRRSRPSPYRARPSSRVARSAAPLSPGGTVDGGALAYKDRRWRLANYELAEHTVRGPGRSRAATRAGPCSSLGAANRLLPASLSGQTRSGCATGAITPSRPSAGSSRRDADHPPHPPRRSQGDRLAVDRGYQPGYRVDDATPSSTTKGPACRAFPVAGAGFEPATSGL